MAEAVAADNEVLREGVRAVERVLDEERRMVLQQVDLTDRAARLIAFTLAAFITIVGLLLNEGQILPRAAVGFLAAGVLAHVSGLVIAAVNVHAMGRSLRPGADPEAVRDACADPDWSAGSLLSSLLEAYSGASAMNAGMIQRLARWRSWALVLWIAGLCTQLAGFSYILLEGM